MPVAYCAAGADETIALIRKHLGKRHSVQISDGTNTALEVSGSIGARILTAMAGTN